MPFNQQIRILTRDDANVSNPRPDPRPNNIPDIKYGMSDIVHIFVPRLMPSIEPNLGSSQMSRIIPPKSRPIRLSTHKVEFNDDQNITPDMPVQNKNKNNNTHTSNAHNNNTHTSNAHKSEKIRTCITRYPSGNIKSVAHILNGKLHHYFKPALSFYRDDINNTLIKECFYEYGSPSDKQEGVFKKIYNI